MTVSATSTTAAPTSTTSAKTAGTNSKPGSSLGAAAGMGKDDFMQLLIAQLEIRTR